MIDQGRRYQHDTRDRVRITPFMQHTAPAPKNAAGTFLALAFVSIHPASDILDAISSALESAIQRYAPDVDLQLLATGKGVPGKPAHEGPGELHMSLSRCDSVQSCVCRTRIGMARGAKEPHLHQL